MKRFWWNLSGAFGDIGVFLPIAIALIGKNGFNPTALFVIAGLFYISSGAYFKITMPVQPLKAMAAIAIATGLSTDVINTAGIIMGFILVLIAVTGFSVRLGNLFPISVVRGIQLGLGLMLIKTSWEFIKLEPLIFLLTLLLLLSSLLLKGMPPLIPVLLLSVPVIFNRVTIQDTGPFALKVILPQIGDFWEAFTLLVLPQLALSFGNAIVATEVTAKDLYKEKASRVNLKSIPVSMGIANIVSGLFGGVPMCHGSGGLTAHYKFGARDERAGYIIGIFFIIFGLLFGKSILSIISVFPSGILGTLLLYIGLQHSLFMRSIWHDRGATFIALLTAITGFILNNLTYGFLLGIATHYGYLFFSRYLKLNKSFNGGPYV